MGGQPPQNGKETRRSSLHGIIRSLRALTREKSREYGGYVMGSVCYIALCIPRAVSYAVEGAIIRNHSF